MTSIGRLRATAVLALGAYIIGLTLLVLIDLGRHPAADPSNAWTALIALPPTIVLGLLVTWRRPSSPAGPALIALAAAPCLTWAVESWGETYRSAHPWPAAQLGAVIGNGAWVFNFAGFVLLCLVFPDGPLPGRRWAWMPWIWLAAAVTVNLLVSLDPAQFAARGGELPAVAPLQLTRPIWIAAHVVAGVAFLAVLGAAVASLVLRYRRGGDVTRLQLRWLMLGAGSVPVLLGAGWVAQAAGASVSWSYTGFLVALLIVMPASVAIGILRHDLLDVDRLLGESVSWVITSLVSAGVFATIVLGAARLSAGHGPGITVAAFVTALVLLPVYHRVHQAAGRIFDRERTVMLATVGEFVTEVRDGRAQPEQVQDALRKSLDDPELIVLLLLPGSAEYVDLAGKISTPTPELELIPLTARDADVGAIVLGRRSARRIRRAREAAVEARLPIEVSRLRVELRRALDDAQSSRSRLVEAVTDERRRLERDLHDGAQQRIIAVGMRLRSIQRRLPATEPSQQELDAAVAALEVTVAELRRLAHGIRPSRLDDGLDVALHDLVSDSPIPVTVQVGALKISEAVATTAYFVVAECLANTLKHAGASRADVTLTQALERLTVQVSDDGRGGALSGFGLTALADRVAALGGHILIDSPAGSGTTIRAEL